MAGCVPHQVMGQCSPWPCPQTGAGDSHHSGHRARVTPEGLLCAVPGHSCVRHPLNGVVHTAWLVRVEAPACSMTARHTGGTRRRQHSRPKVWVLAAVGVATGAPSQAGQHTHTHTCSGCLLSCFN